MSYRPDDAGPHDSTSNNSVAANTAPDKALLDGVLAACRELIEARFPTPGIAGAAAMLLSDGSIVAGTAPDTVHSGVELCHETEPFCAAFRLDQRILASACLSRDEYGRFLVFSPCGICRERLAIHGPELLAAVASPDDPTVAVWKRLKDIHRDYWLTAVMDPREAAAWRPTGEPGPIRQ